MGQFNKKTELIISNDSLRPNHCKVYFKNGFLYTTDGHILIKQRLSLFGFVDKEIEFLNGQSLTKEQWMMIKKFDFQFPKEGSISCSNDIYESIKFDFKFTEERHDNKLTEMIDKVISDCESLSQQTDIKFCLDLLKLEKIRKCMFLTHDKSVIFEAKHMNRGIILYSEGAEFKKEDQLVLLMPISIQNLVEF